MAFAAPLLLPVLTAPVIRFLVANNSIRTVFTAAFSLLFVLYGVAAVVGQLSPVLAIGFAMIAGWLDGVIRVGRLVAAKVVARGSTDSSRLLSHTFLLQFLASGTGGLVMAILPQPLQTAHLFIVCSIFAGIAMAVSLGLPAILPQGQTGAAASRRIIPLRLTVPFWRLVAFTSVTQGIFNASRVTLPAAHASQDASAVGMFQVAVSVGAIAGATALVRIGIGPAIRHERWMTLTMVGVALVAVSLHSIWWSLVSYLLFILFFEIVFIARQTALNEMGLPEEIPALASYQYSFCYFGICLVTMLSSWLIDKWSLLGACAVFMLFAIASMFVNRSPVEIDFASRVNSIR